jgi:acyl-CoA thioester hydrolase
MGKVVYREPVHTFHIDINDHVNNAVYVQWLEVGRTKLIEAIGLSVPIMRERGYTPVLIETRIRYRAPLTFPDTARIEVWVESMTNASAWMAFRVTSETTGKVAATAKQRGIFIHAETGRPHRLSGEDRRKFDAVFEPDETVEA